MAKEVVVLVYSTPDVPGWNDTVLVVEDDRVVYACPCRSGPNWRTPMREGGKPWHVKYDCIAPGQYTWVCVPNHPRYGSWLVINGGGEVASRNPRPNPDGSIFTEVGFHAAWSERWPGSAGCQTLQRVFWKGFIRMFEPGERGVLSVRDVG